MLISVRSESFRPLWPWIRCQHIPGPSEHTLPYLVGTGKPRHLSHTHITSPGTSVSSPLRHSRDNALGYTEMFTDIPLWVCFLHMTWHLPSSAAWTSKNGGEHRVHRGCLRLAVLITTTLTGQAQSLAPSLTPLEILSRPPPH